MLTIRTAYKMSVSALADLNRPQLEKLAAMLDVPYDARREPMELAQLVYNNLRNITIPADDRLALYADVLHNCRESLRSIDRTLSHLTLYPEAFSMEVLMQLDGSTREMRIGTEQQYIRSSEVVVSYQAKEIT